MSVRTRCSASSKGSSPDSLTRGNMLKIFQDLKTEKKFSENLNSRVSSIEKVNSSKFVTRSVTPLSSKLMNPRTLDLASVSKSSISYQKNVNKTERKPVATPSPSPSLFRISPLDNSVSSSEKNIENLRLELQQRREMIVGLKETVSRKQLEHKYWTLVSQIEETTSRLISLKTYNKDIQQEINDLNCGRF